MQTIMPPINTEDGLFHEGNPTQGTQGTIVTALFLNNVQGATQDTQKELTAILTEAGMLPDGTKTNQVITAIKKLISNIPEAPVKSVNSRTGAVTISASDVGLGNVGNFTAVQQGGISGTFTNKIYLAWSGSRVVVQVDTTQLGGLYSTLNPPTAAEVNALSLSGGTVTGDVNVTGNLTEVGQRVYSSRNPPPITQQAVIGLRLSGRTIIPDTGGRIDLPSGCVYTGMSGANYPPSVWAAYSMLQININGTWLNVTTV